MAQDETTRPQGEPTVSDALDTAAAEVDAALSPGQSVIEGYLPAPADEDHEAGMPGENLVGELAEPEPFEVVDDEAEELDDDVDSVTEPSADQDGDDTDDDAGEQADETDETVLVDQTDESDDEGEFDELDATELVDEQADDVEIDDPKQLADAEAVAIAATSSRPVKRVKRSTADATDAVEAETSRPVRKKTTAGAPARKSTKTPSRKETAPARTRTGPVQFVRESIAELRKVVWPTGTQVQQYFVVVLIFVLFIIAFVGLLDLGLGWALLKLLG